MRTSTAVDVRAFNGPPLGSVVHAAVHFDGDPIPDRYLCGAPVRLLNGKTEATCPECARQLRELEATD